MAEAGLQVGRDIAVVSFDNEELICSLLRSGLSTMAPPYFQMGQAAREATLAARDPPGNRNLLPCTLFNRDSFSNAAW